MFLTLQPARFLYAALPNEVAQTGSLASTYVPIESWIYPAFDRLAAAGLVQTAFVGLRPWTRGDCARLVEEAEETRFDQTPIEQEQEEDGAGAFLRALQEEFAPELRRRDGAQNREVVLEALDTRSTAIAGRPLNDGYHFAQTLADDYGRPFGRGENVYSGIAGRALWGPFAVYARGEFQRAAALPGPNPTAQTAIAAADFAPAAALGPPSGFLRGRLIEANAAFAFGNNQLVFGRQSLWWGPGRSGPLLFSNNAEPLTMLRYDRLQPFLLPGPLRLLGPIRVQLFAGRLRGQQCTHVGNRTFGTPGVALSDQPFLHGQKVSFKPTPNFEFSVSRTTIFGGAGAPVTTHTVLRSLFSTGTGREQLDPGDRRVGFDAQYRVPGLRTCLTTYVDAFTDDEPFPVAYPTESAWSPGLYLTCVPHLPRVTVRAEGLLTPKRDLFPGFYYFNVHYLSGYTNERDLLGNSIGREGDGGEAWTTWSLSPRSSLEANLRSTTVSHDFLQGGHQLDLSLTADLALRRQWRVRVSEQYERWRFPLLASSGVRDSTTTVQLTYFPAAGRNR